MDVDPESLLEWLGVPGDMQIVALEQLCMLLLLADNVDRVFERYGNRVSCGVLHHPRCPPQTFIPALSQIFLDESAAVSTLEAAMRAVTFYLEVSADCARRVVRSSSTASSVSHIKGSS